MPHAAAAAEPQVRHLDIGSPEFKRDAFATYRELNAECPAHRVVAFNSDETGDQQAFFNRPVALVTGYDAATSAMLDPRLTVNVQSVMTDEQLAHIPKSAEEFRPLLRSMLNLDPPDHTRLRKLVQKPFTAGQIENLARASARTPTACTTRRSPPPRSAANPRRAAGWT